MKRSLSFLLMSMILLMGSALADVGSVKGTVVDSNGDPVGAAQVSLQDGIFSFQRVFTKSDGSYVFTDVEEGTFNVIASRKKIGSFVVENVKVVAGQTTRVPMITLGGTIPTDSGNGPQYHGTESPDDILDRTVLDMDLGVAKAAAAIEEITLDAVKSLYR